MVYRPEGAGHGEPHLEREGLAQQLHNPVRAEPDALADHPDAESNDPLAVTNHAKPEPDGPEPIPDHTVSDTNPDTYTDSDYPGTADGLPLAAVALRIPRRHQHRR